MISPRQRAHNNRWTFLIVISIGLFLIGADNSILYTALPELRAQLGTSETEALWVINAYPLVLASLLLGTGTLGDKIGHRRMFELGLIIFGLSSFFAALATSPLLLILGRALLAVGAATMMPATLALLRITFTDVRERNTAIGIWASVATIGAASGPVMGGFLLEHFYWGSVFLINVPIAFAALLATQLMAPANQPNHARHWDLTSSLQAMATMFGVVLIIKELASDHTRPWLLGAAAALALICGCFFNRRQQRLDEPLLTWDVFRNPVFSAGVIAAGIAMFVLSGTEMLTTQRFQLAEGFSPLQAGLVTAAVAISAFPTSILGGAVLHRVGFLPLITGGFALMALGGGLTYWAVHNHSVLGLLIVSLMFVGAGSGLTMSVSSTAIIGSAPAHRSGMAASIEEVSYEFGTLLSIAVLGSLFPFFYARRVPSEIAHDYEQGLSDPLLHDVAREAINAAYGNILIFAAIAAILAGVATAVLLKDNPKETEYAHE